MTEIPEFHGSNPDRTAIAQAFAEVGVVLVRRCVPSARVKAFTHATSALIQSRLRSLGVESSEAEPNIDRGLTMLQERDPSYAMDLIRALKNAPAFYGFLTEPAILEVAGMCLKSNSILSIHDIDQVRIDPPEYFVRNFDWHQDYPYNVASLNSVTGWFPMTPVVEPMGQLAVVPGSHGEIAPVQSDASRHRSGQGTGHSVWQLSPTAHPAEGRYTVAPPMEPGDGLFFHSLLIHRSGRNTSNRARWVINPRYSDAADPTLVSRGWRTASDKQPDLFATLHADKVESARESAPAAS